MFDISIQNDTEIKIDTLPLHEAAVTTLAHQKVAPSGSVAIVLVDDATIQALNLAYREEDKPTDVLSFEDGDIPFSGAPPHLGDIAIALPYAQRQAAKAGNEITAELQLLTIHGTLHLLGHDHAEADEKAIMWHAQREILELLDCHVTLSHA